MSTEVVPEKVDNSDFLERVHQQFPVRWVFYPGCGEDITLTAAFPKNKIVYLDKDKWATSISDKGNLVLGNYEKAPFKDQAFDVVFIQDTDIATAEELSDILRTLRPDGIVIHSSLGDCELYPRTFLSYFERISSLTKQKLDFSNPYYTVFKKTSTDNTLPEITEEELMN